MKQCAMVDQMKDPCSCTYDRMTAQMPMETMAMSLEGGNRDPAVSKVIQGALAACTAKYR